MKTIWKYPLPLTHLVGQAGQAVVEIDAPAGARVLGAAEQRGQVCVWALVDTVMPVTRRTFEVYGTGHPVADHSPDRALRPVGTVLQVGGDLVLHVFEAATPERLWLSDQICTGLQLTEHWQDVAEDFAQDRVNLPQEDLDRFGYALDDLSVGRVNRQFRQLMEFEVDRARARLSSDTPFHLRVTWLFAGIFVL